MQTYAEHRAQVDVLDAELRAAAQRLHLTADERALVELVLQHSVGAKRGLTALLHRIV